MKGPQSHVLTNTSTQMASSLRSIRVEFLNSSPDTTSSRASITKRPFKISTPHPPGTPTYPASLPLPAALARSTHPLIYGPASAHVNSPNVAIINTQTTTWSLSESLSARTRQHHASTTAHGSEPAHGNRWSPRPPLFSHSCRWEGCSRCRTAGCSRSRTWPLGAG